MIWIIGKNASVATFPEGFFADKETMGLNGAALRFNAHWAFSVYPVHIKEFLAAGVPIERIIGVKPRYDVQGQVGLDHWPNYYPGIMNDPLVYNNRTPGQLPQIREEMNRLYMTRDKVFPYGNYGTCAQLAIYWCVLHNKLPINMAGCNQDDHCLPGCPDCHSGKKACPVGTDKWAASRAYTREVVRCLNIYGDIVRLYENYADYVERTKA